jgi:peptide deformylase
MAKLPIIVAPDPRLKLVAAPVNEVDDGVRRLIDDMLETMYAAPGIGLAAPQVGVRKRVIVVDLAREGEAPAPHCLVNPTLESVSEETGIYEEGCLSLPQHFADVERPEHATISYLDRDGAEQTLVADGMLATCIQHEIDHLDGVLFVDHISRIKRGMILRKLAKMKKTNPDDLPHFNSEHA